MYSPRAPHLHAINALPSNLSLPCRLQSLSGRDRGRVIPEHLHPEGLSGYVGAGRGFGVQNPGRVQDGWDCLARSGCRTVWGTGSKQGAGPSHALGTECRAIWVHGPGRMLSWISFTIPPAQVCPSSELAPRASLHHPKAAKPQPFLPHCCAFAGWSRLVVAARGVPVDSDLQ